MNMMTVHTRTTEVRQQRRMDIDNPSFVRFGDPPQGQKPGHTHEVYIADSAGERCLIGNIIESAIHEKLLPFDNLDRNAALEGSLNALYVTARTYDVINFGTQRTVENAIMQIHQRTP